MCKENRDYFLLLLFLLLLSSVVGALRAQEQPTPGKTQPLSPSNGSSSSNSSEDLRTWETLSWQFQQDLTNQSMLLSEALKELEASKASSGTLTSLLEASSRANENLRSYNSQIAERMQERDEDLSSAYDRIDVLEKRFLKAVIAIIVLGAFIAVVAAIKIVRFFRL